MEQDRNMTEWSYRDQAVPHREWRPDRSLQDATHLPLKEEGGAA
jgi:hypothetical protein